MLPLGYVSEFVVIGDEVGIFNGGLAGEVVVLCIFFQLGPLVAEKVEDVGPVFYRQKMAFLLEEIELFVFDGLFEGGRGIGVGLGELFAGVEEEAHLIVDEHLQQGISQLFIDVGPGFAGDEDAGIKATGEENELADG